MEGRVSIEPMVLGARVQSVQPLGECRRRRPVHSLDAGTQAQGGFLGLRPVAPGQRQRWPAHLDAHAQSRVSGQRHQNQMAGADHAQMDGECSGHPLLVGDRAAGPSGRRHPSRRFRRGLQPLRRGSRCDQSRDHRRGHGRDRGHDCPLAEGVRRLRPEVEALLDQRRGHRRRRRRPGRNPDGCGLGRRGDRSGGPPALSTGG